MSSFTVNQILEQLALGFVTSQFPGQMVCGFFDQKVEKGGNDDCQAAEGQRDKEVVWLTTENLYPDQPTNLQEWVVNQIEGKRDVAEADQ